MNIFFIVVGGGSAGSLLASRLTEDKSSVLVLEAGGSDLENEATVIPGAWATLLRSKQDWNYHSVPQKHSSFAMKDQVNTIYQYSIYRKVDSLFPTIFDCTKSVHNRSKS